MAELASSNGPRPDGTGIMSLEAFAAATRRSWFGHWRVRWGSVHSSVLVALSTFLMAQVVLSTVVVVVFGAIVASFDDMILADGYFTVASAFSSTGLVVTDFAQLSHASQTIVCCLMFLGSVPISSAVITGVKLWYARKRRSNYITIEDGDQTGGMPSNQLDGAVVRDLRNVIVLIVGASVSIVLCGGLILGIWASLSESGRAILREETDKVSPFTFGFMHAVSAYCNAGFSILPNNASMVPFRMEPFPLLWLSILSMLGNTMFPVLLRALVETFGMRRVLASPRQYSLHLFDRSTTLSIFLINLIVTSLGVVWFYLSNQTAPELANVSSGDVFMNALFNSAMTRTCGFNSVDIGQLPVSLLVVYMSMMFFSACPVWVSMAGLAAGEASEVRIQASASDAPDLEGKKPSVTSHFRRILEQHLILLLAALVLLCRFEQGPVDSSSDPDFSFLALSFELISAYATAGLSIGYPNVTASFSARLSVPSKITVSAIMLMGRLRSLPATIFVSDVVVNPVRATQADYDISLQETTAQ